MVPNSFRRNRGNENRTKEIGRPMKTLPIGVAIALIVVQVLVFASPAQAKRRTVFEPKSGYCLSLVHVSNIKYCKERRGK
jgi:hypothetical protein